ncbi:MAG: hypothetical protein KatS3mg082_1773 [Nitrospiraceae bacterium]|nr:MAG: hypothetical protein KatS3mg082_1773 [Nitrospiraceae bacterium]
MKARPLKHRVAELLRDGPMTVCQVAERLGVEREPAWRACKSLQQEGRIRSVGRVKGGQRLYLASGVEQPEEQQYPEEIRVAGPPYARGLIFPGRWP